MAHIAMLLSKSYLHDHRVSKEAHALVAAGHRVTVVEWARHHPEAPQAETIGPVHLERIHDTGLLRWAPGTVGKNPLWWRRASARVRRLHVDDPVHVVHAHDLDTLPAGVQAARALRVPLVYDAHERFHEIIQGTHPRAVVRAAERLELRLLPRVDAVVTVSTHLRQTYERLVGPEVPVVDVWNCFGPPPGADTPRAPGADVFTVTYIGILSRDRLFPASLHALGGLDGVRFVVAGKREGVHAEVERAAADHANVDYLGPVPFDQVLPRTEAGHAVLCLLDPTNPQYRHALATKLFDAMSTGRPIIVSADTAMADFVAQHEVGVVCPYSIDGVRDAVRRLRDDPALCRRLGQNGLRLARSTYNWPRQSERLVDLYTRLLGRDEAGGT